MSSHTLISSSLDGGRKYGDGGQAPAAWEFVRRKILVFAMSLSQSIISLRERVPSSRVIAWWPASIGADDLVLSSPQFLGSDTHSKESDPPSI